MWGDIVIAFLLACMIAYVITPYTIRLAKKIGAVDKPGDERRINKEEMPRLGGLAVVSGFIVSTIYLIIIMSIEKSIDLNGTGNYGTKLIGFFAGLIVLEIVCFIDDVKQISPIFKLLGQMVASIIVIKSGIIIENVNIPMYKIGFNEVISIIVTMGWIIGITNAMNLTDGLDGLSSGISIISCLSLLIIFATNGSPLISIILITALAGAVVGFLPFNFNPAKTFIGDTGSNFLGFSLAIISILGVAKTYTAIVLIAPVIVLGLPVFDTIFAIIRRLIKGKSIKAVLSADKGHLHHRIMNKGYTQKQAVLILYGISASFGMFAIILLESGIWKALSFLLMIIAFIAIGYKDILNIRNEEDNILNEEKEKS